MTRFLGLLIVFGVMTSCTNQQKENYNFTINGTLEGDYLGLAKLYKRTSGEWIALDSAQVENNTFVFRGNIGLPEFYYIDFGGDNNFIGFFVEQSDISFKISLNESNDPEVSGSASNDEYRAYLEKADAFDSKLGDAWNNIKTARAEGNREGEKKWEDEYNRIENEQKKFIIGYAKTNYKSVVSAYVVLRNVYHYDESDLEPVVNSFDPSISESYYVKQLTERVETMQRIAIGQPAVDFTMGDMEGNPQTLSSLYGKYLLVDFWASWCGPCRRENPNVVSAYKTYSNKGFDILGVSFDKDKEKWLNAVRDDELTWHQVSDLKGWGNEAGKLYAVSSIPANILLDPEGKIIAKNLRGEDLHEKLAELLGK